MAREDSNEKNQGNPGQGMGKKSTELGRDNRDSDRMSPNPQNRGGEERDTSQAGRSGSKQEAQDVDGDENIPQGQSKQFSGSGGQGSNQGNRGNEGSRGVNR